jgi:hypothetical protein
MRLLRARDRGSVSSFLRGEEGNDSERERTGVVERFARFSVPEQGRLSLSGDPDSLELVARVTFGFKEFEAGGDALVDLGGVDGRVVFVPARFRVHCVGRVEHGESVSASERASAYESRPKEGRRSPRRLTLFEFDLVVSDDVCPLVKDVEPARRRSAVDSPACSAQQTRFFQHRCGWAWGGPTLPKSVSA